MRAFLLLDLSSGAAAYQQPLLAQVKQAWPEVETLDLDAGSTELLLHYTLRLLREAGKAVVLVKAAAETEAFGKAMPLLEELLLPQEGRLVLLLGPHPRLQRMLQARPQVSFRQVETESEALAETDRFFAAASG